MQRNQDCDGVLMYDPDEHKFSPFISPLFPYQIDCGLAFSVLLSTTSTLHHSGQNVLLYLPTQIRFLIGGERVTCH